MNHKLEQALLLVTIQYWYSSLFIYLPQFLGLLQIKYILFVGENTAGTNYIKMRQAIQK